jgi:hypothetical protein
MEQSPEKSESRSASSENETKLLTSAITLAHYCTLSIVNAVHSVLPYVFIIHFNIFLSSTSRLFKYFLPFRFCGVNVMSCAPHVLPISSYFDFIALIAFGEQTKLLSSLLCSSSLSAPYALLRNLTSGTPNLNIAALSSCQLQRILCP